MDLWPSPLLNKNQGGTSCEWYLNAAIPKMVIALVVKRIGFNEKIGRAWLDVDCPWEHPKLEREAIRPPPLDETEREPERKHTYGEFCEIRIDFDDATTYNDDYKNEVNGVEVYEKVIEPIINSFVHQTSWAEDLRRFSKEAEAWMDSVKSLGVDFFKDEGFSDYIQKMAKDDWYADIECDEWWKGFDETRTEHFAQFKITLEYFTRRLAQLICELDEVFLITTCPKTLEIARKRLEWELLAVDYVRREGDIAYLFHYGTAGEYFFYKDFVLPEQQKQQQQRNDDFMEQKRREHFMNSSGMMTS
jgi:hypothetical protein